MTGGKYMNENGKQLTSEERIKFIEIILKKGGFFGLLEELDIKNPDEIFAKIKVALHSSSKEEVQSIDEVLGIKSTSASQEKEIGTTEDRPQNSLATGVDSASIYSKEHLEAVQDDLRTHREPIHKGEDMDPSLSQPKVLERRMPPVNFVGCETVAPGQFKK